MGEFPHVGPPTDGLHLAMATARERRLRKAGISSGFTAAALLVVALVAGTSGRSTLVQEPKPDVPAVVSVDRVPGPAPARRTTATTPLTLPGAAVPAASAAPSAATPPAPARPGVTTTRPAVPPAGGTVSVTEPMRTGYVSPATAGCPFGGYGPAFCASYSRAADGSSEVLQATVCSLQASSVDLHFTTDLEVDVLVADRTGRTLWRWSAQNPPSPDPHTLGLDPGECVQWSTTWRVVDAAGRRLAKGDYTIRTTSTASELRGRETVSQPYTVS